MNRCKRTAKLYQIGKKAGEWTSTSHALAKTIRKVYRVIVGVK